MILEPKYRSSEITELRKWTRQNLQAIQKVTCAPNGNSGWNVSDSDCAFYFVDILSPCTTSSRSTDIEVYFRYVDIKGILLENGHHFNTSKTRLRMKEITVLHKTALISPSRPTRSQFFFCTWRCLGTFLVNSIVRMENLERTEPRS